MAFKIKRFIPASPLTLLDPDPKELKEPKIDPTKLKYKDTKSVSTINNNAFAIQKIDILAKIGRLL